MHQEIATNLEDQAEGYDVIPAHKKKPRYGIIMDAEMWEKDKQDEDTSKKGSAKHTRHKSTTSCSTSSNSSRTGYNADTSHNSSQGHHQNGHTHHHHNTKEGKRGDSRYNNNWIFAGDTAFDDRGGAGARGDGAPPRPRRSLRPRLPGKRPTGPSWCTPTRAFYRSHNGVLRLCQLVFGVICIILGSFIGSPAHIFFLVVAVICFVVSGFFFVFYLLGREQHCTQRGNAFPWPLLDVTVGGIQTVLYFSASFAEAATSNNDPVWVTAAVFGFLNTVTYGFHTYIILADYIESLRQGVKAEDKTAPDTGWDDPKPITSHL